MLIACLVAFYVPFELFLFSYAVLGPAHYLTEISWLHERKYFSKGKRDYIFLGIAGLILFLLIYVTPKLHVFNSDTNGHLTTAVVYIAFIASLAMVVLKDPFHRFIAFLLICASAFISTSAVLFFSVFLPTLIHVFLFTGLFMLYGALKGRSKSGYLSVFVFFLCPLLFVFITPESFGISAYAIKTYPMFHTVNIEAIKLFDANIFNQFKEHPIDAIYKSKLGLIIMRFIAFAYTYHYLNWFSKTTVIKWHQVPKKRLILIASLWIISVGLYYYKYEVGFHVLFLLSFLHVFLEFPLNHVTFIGIFKEFGSIIRGNKTPIPVKANFKGKKK
jgi:hypothetical protein